MARKVLTEASDVKCGSVAPHQGTVSMTGAARLVVDNNKVLTTVSVLAGTVSAGACTNPSNAGGPCTKVLTMTNGTSTRLKVDGAFVVLDSLQGTLTLAGTLTVINPNNDLLKAD